ncbi:hypothetical protein HIM_12644 [Hirsutella minnesotensis 3608]|nr:hypothetical protein HIM_12644 [Hirsutella minnesotensis 3608]
MTAASKRWLSAPVAMVALFLLGAMGAATPSKAPRYGIFNHFAPIDPQKWVNPDDMTWADFKAPPDTEWNDPRSKGKKRNFNIALIAVDYEDRHFAITGPPNSTIYGNPMPAAANVAREDVPAFYRDLLNKPTKLNRGHTIHEYWMEDSGGRFGVDLTAFGVYRLPSMAYQYGLERWLNQGACPPGKECNLSLRQDSLAMWRKDVGDKKADSFELVFILSAGQDESSTWQEFGEMMFNSKEDIPDSFGPPRNARNDSSVNFAPTRYVEWTSWAAASNIWPNAGSGSSTQCESSGMGTYAHELSHLLNISDNYNNPYGKPLRRDFTGPWSMMSRGSFNGPGGPHTRWQIPSLQGGSMGSLHTVRDKFQLGLMEESSLRRISRETLGKVGVIVANITARSVQSNLMGLRVEMGTDLSPSCNISTDVLCDGGDYDNYDVEVIDRMGADSFQPDAGVMISKTKTEDTEPFQWTIDANPQDINLVNFIRPNGSASMATIGDYRQLADALFHAGTNSGSKAEYVDKENLLHFYIVDKHRTDKGVLSYTVGVRALNSTDKSRHSVKVSQGTRIRKKTTTGKGDFCSFKLTNSGKSANMFDSRYREYASLMGSDIIRLRAEVDNKRWRIEERNLLHAIKFGESKDVHIAAAADTLNPGPAVVTLTATSESNPTFQARAHCTLRLPF